MTAPAQRTQAGATVVGGLATCVDDLAHLVGGCLVEAADGRLVAQRLTGTSVPQAAVDAVLAADARGLHAALSRPRTTCLLPSGPVVEGLLGEAGGRVAHVLLRSGAGLWLLPRDGAPLDLEHLPALLQRLEDLLMCSAEDGHDLAPWLDGDAPAPPAIAGRTWRLARLEAPGVSGALLVRAVSCGTAVRHRGGVYLVLPAGPVPQPRLEHPARMVVSAPTSDLVRARHQLDAALPAVPLGSCLTMEQARPLAVLRHAAAALAALPDLGPDPLAVLGGSDLLLTVRTWLETGGDTVRTADVLGVHSNTLRYRLRRVNDLLETDLRHDAAMRLELHLRLLAGDLTASGRSRPS